MSSLKRFIPRTGIYPSRIVVGGKVFEVKEGCIYTTSPNYKYIKEWFKYDRKTTTKTTAKEA